MSHMPPGFSSVTPYLTVINAQGLIDFIIATFQAEVVSINHTEDGKVANAVLKIGNSVIEISDARDEWGPIPAALHVYVPDVDAVVARALKAQGTALHRIMDMDYGERSGAIRDPFGNNWYIATYTG